MMNAYELADKLQELDAKLHLIVLFKSSEMLRQQADRIADLETTLAFKKMKPLSDEEISQVYKEISEPFGEKRLYEIHDFARAIEERHGIK
jgi:phage FluMu protein gp41